MAEKLKPIEGYTITTFSYGETFYLCDTCGMAVAPERTSDHPKFEHTDDHVKPNPMEGYTITELEHGMIAQVCDTCGRWVSGGRASLRLHLTKDHAPTAQERTKTAAAQTRHEDRRRVTSGGGLDRDQWCAWVLGAAAGSGPAGAAKKATRLS